MIKRKKLLLMAIREGLEDAAEGFGERGVLSLYDREKYKIEWVCRTVADAVIRHTWRKG